MDRQYFDNSFVYNDANAVLPPRQAPLRMNFSDPQQPTDDFRDFVPSSGEGVQSRDAVPDSIRHRRSRNGCLTCRNRRVKCDETRPCCERCRKGGRECVFPEAAPKSKTSKAAKRSTTSTPVDKNVQQNDKDSADDQSTTYSEVTSSKSPSEPSSDQKQLDFSESHSSPAKSFSSAAPSPSSMADTMQCGLYGKESSPQLRRWSTMDSNLRFYLQYHKDKLNNCHYGLTCDSSDFLHSYLVEHALANETLLYAVVSFAAYHHTLSTPGGSLQDFLGYYSKSLSMLRVAIQHTQSVTMDMLLTILVLCLLEECLSDWVNLSNHQKAAYKILTNLHTPQTITANYQLSKVLELYIHFDCIAGFMAGAETLLSRDWYEAQRAFYARMVQQEQQRHPMTPMSHTLLTYIYEEKHAATRLLAKDVSIFFARKAKSLAIDAESFNEAAELVERMDDWHRTINPLIVDKTKVITNVPTTLPWDSTGAFELGSDIPIYGGELLPTNNMLAGIWGLELLFKSSLALMQRNLPPTEVQELAGKICRVVEVVEYADQRQGSILCAQASLGIACVFVRRESELITWCRQKQAMIEQLGYFQPLSFRAKLSESWGVDLNQGWVTTDEGYAPILKSIRDFIDYRTTPVKDQISENMREMTGIFMSLSLNADIHGYI